MILRPDRHAGTIIDERPAATPPGGSMEQRDQVTDDKKATKKIKLEIKRLEKVETTGLREGG
jgi:hypothetical protein